MAEGPSSQTRLTRRARESRAPKAEERAPKRRRSQEVPLEEAPRPDDEHGHLTFREGDLLTQHLRILDLLGTGTFGQVLHCRSASSDCAVKIIRSVPKYRIAAEQEISALQKVSGCAHCVQLREHFKLFGHFCLVFDKLGPSLYDVLKRRGFAGFDLSFVRDVSRQLLHAVSLVHSCNLAHTDVKVENVLLLKGDERSERRVQLIDFGSTADTCRFHRSLVSTRHYRAPEVVLGIPWNSKIDCWSCGTLFVELLHGYALFHTHDPLEHLLMMERALGPIPRHIKLKSAEMSKPNGLLNASGELECQTASNKSQNAVKQLHPLNAYVHSRVNGPEADAFYNLLRGLLTYDPSQRLSAEAAMEQRFVKQGGDDKSSVEERKEEGEEEQQWLRRRMRRQKRSEGREKHERRGRRRSGG